METEGSLLFSEEPWSPWHCVIFRTIEDPLYGLVVRVSGYRSSGPGSIPGATGFFEK
jgi:hypothetical protein